MRNSDRAWLALAGGVAAYDLIAADDDGVGAVQSLCGHPRPPVVFLAPRTSGPSNDTIQSRLRFMPAGQDCGAESPPADQMQCAHDSARAG